jgi:hypothetical protein
MDLAMFRNEVEHTVATETVLSGCSETAAPRFGNRRLTLMGSIAVLVGGFIPMSACGSPETVSANTEQPLVVTQGSPAPSVAPAGSTPTPEEVGAADKKLEEQLRNGWIPFGGAVPGVPGVSSPDSAWMRTKGGIPSDPAEANAERVVEFHRSERDGGQDGRCLHTTLTSGESVVGAPA